MAVKEHKLEFERVLSKLRLWREQVIVELRLSEGHDEALQLKRQIDTAINCLKFCQQHQIQPNAEVTVLPDTQTQTPSSNYRILEDHETDNQDYWIELKINDEPLHLCPSDIIIS